MIEVVNARARAEPIPSGRQRRQLSALLLTETQLEYLRGYVYSYVSTQLDAIEAEYGFVRVEQELLSDGTPIVIIEGETVVGSEPQPRAAPHGFWWRCIQGHVCG